MLATRTAWLLAALLTAGGCDDARDDAAIGAAAPAGSDLEVPIATIDGQVITVRDFQDRINEQSPYIRARYNSAEQKKEFLDSLIRYEVLAREAYRRGLDRDPDAVRAMKTVMIQKLMKAELEELAGPEAVPEAELRAYYDAHPDKWNEAEEVRVTAIVLDDARAADEVARLALGPDGKTSKGFRDLVAKHSTDEPSRLRGGDLRYFTGPTDEVPAAVAEAAFKLARTGEVAGPIAAGGRFYVIKQTGRRRAVARTYEQVKRQIQNTLWKERRAEAQQRFIEGLRGKAKVEVVSENLAKVKISSTPAPASPEVP